MMHGVVNREIKNSITTLEKTSEHPLRLLCLEVFGYLLADGKIQKTVKCPPTPTYTEMNSGEIGMLVY